MLIRLLSPITFLAAIASALTITPSSSISGGGLTVKYSGASSDVAIVILAVYAGGDSLDTAALIGPGTAGPNSATSGSVTIKFTKADGPPDDNAYFIQATENLAGGSSDLSYSNRFSIDGMTGSFKPAGTNSAAEVEAAYKKVAKDPKGVPEDSSAQGPAGANPAAGVTGDVQAYSLQTTGTIKMAPMQQKPGSKITKTATTPLYPTTAYKTATKALPTPSFIKTNTVSVAHTIESRPNTGAAAEQPTDDMARFLARWKRLTYILGTQLRFALATASFGV